MNNKIILTAFVALTLFFPSCEKDISTSPKTEEYFDNGALKIESNPSGAKIFFDGRNSGKFTPDSLAWLQDTTHMVTLKLNLFRDTSFQVQTPINEKINRFVDYTLNPNMRGSIKCLSVPTNAEIFLNDSATGTFTPDTIKGLLPGKYKLRLRKESHMDSESEFLVRSGEIAGSELKLVDTTYWVTYTAENSPLISNDLRCIITDQHNNKWIGSAQNGLLKIEGGNWIHYNISNSPLPANEIVTIVEDEFNDDIWVGTPAGFVIIDGTNWTLYNTSNSQLPHNVITAIDIDKRMNRKWVGTQKGLVLIDGLDWYIFNTSNSDISGDYITAIGLNVFGENWFGAAKNGISRYYGVFKKITNYYWTPNYGDPGSTVSCFEVDTVGGVTYIGFIPERSGTGLGGLTTFNGANFSNRYPGIPSREVLDIEIAENGFKWVATAKGIVKFMNWSDKIVYGMAQVPLKSEYVTNISVDKSGYVWFTTLGGGLTKYKGDAISKK